MTLRPIVPRRSAEEWLARIFDCRATETGGIIKRQARDVDRDIGHHVLLAEVQRRGFRLFRTRYYYVIVCEAGPVEMLC